MATNFTAQQSLDYAERFIGDLPITDSELKLRILNDSAAMMHLYSNWRWSVSAASEGTLVDEQADYTVSLTNELYALRAHILDSAGNNIGTLKPTHGIVTGSRIRGMPTQVELVNSTTIRFFPTPDGFPSGSKFHFYYKTAPTQITEGNIGTASTLDFPDEWHWVFNEIVLLKAMRFSSNELEGGVQTNSQGGFTYSGGWAAVMNALEFMRSREKPFLFETGEAQGA